MITFTNLHSQGLTKSSLSLQHGAGADVNELTGPNRDFLPTLYIGGMPPSIDARRLAEFFAPHVEVRSAKVMLDENGRSKGYGFIEVPDVRSAEHAVATLHDTEMEGVKVAVRIRKVSIEYVTSFAIVCVMCAGF